MAVPIKGAFRERFTVPYSGARVWGTGINPIHAFYGSPPTRLDPLNQREGDITPPWQGVSDSLEAEELWGYTLEEQRNVYFVRDDRPSWDVAPEDDPSRDSTGNQPPYNATGAAKTRFRSTMGGAYSLIRGKLPRANYTPPSETVSEGWINKPTGRAANSVVSDPSQYEIQTSMTQRYRARNNDAAVDRATDASRSHINSRVSGQKLKVYSEGERNYDMFPRQQSPWEERPFYYRSAGTGLQDQMLPNEMYDIDPIERTSPPDPYIGQQEESFQYGYTNEDNFYA
jgi:hypothetical protein